MLANTRAGIPTAEEKSEEQEHKHFSRKLNFDSGTKATTDTMESSLTSSAQLDAKKPNIMNTADTQILTRETCTQHLSVADSKKQFNKKAAQKRKGGELTVDAVKKTLFQTPIKEEEEELSVIPDTVKNYDRKPTSKKVKNKKLENTRENVKNTNVQNKKQIDSADSDIESDQDVFSEEEVVSVKKMKIGGVFAFDPNRNVSDMLADALASTEDDTQDSGSEAGEGTESSVAGEDGHIDVENVMENYTEVVVNDDEDSMATFVEETQDIAHLGEDCHSDTGDTTVVKETQGMYLGDHGDSCYGDTASSTLVDVDSQSREWNEETEEDDDIVLLAAENVDHTPRSPQTNKNESHNISNSQNSQRKLKTGTYQQAHSARKSFSRQSSKKGKLQNAASDSRQSSVMDYFQPLWGKAKQAVMTLSKKFSPGEGVHAAVSRIDGDDLGASTSSATSTCSSVNSTDTAGTSKPWPLRPQATSKAGVTPQYWTNKYNNGANSRGGSEGRSWGQGGKKQCPFYKKMPGTPFTVDAFRYGSIPGCTAYFLTHFHYDHYGGLTKKFKHPVYCSKATANLVRSKLRVEDQYIKALPMEKAVTVEGIQVTLLEANHCPGSVLFLFELPNGQTYLHTGDFRACTEMESYPQLIGRKIHQLYLDTTYCDPAYAFPPQKDVIQFAVKLVRDAVYEHPNMLVVTGTYTIGKERIFMAIAEELNSKVCVTREKKAILECLEDPEIDKRMTLQKTQAKVHVLPMNWLGYEKLSGYLEDLKAHFDSILAISPTGWTHSNKTISLDKIRPKMKRGNITVYGLPYSEHSSFTELKRFVQFTRPDKVLATVNNGNPASRRKMDALFQSWLSEATNTPKKEAKQKTLTSWFK